MMDVDNSTDRNPSLWSSQSKYITKTVTWSTDTGISVISDDLFNHLKHQLYKDEDAGVLETDHPKKDQSTHQVQFNSSSRHRF
jgi:hypothetical protein